MRTNTSILIVCRFILQCKREWTLIEQSCSFKRKETFGLPNYVFNLIGRHCSQFAAFVDVKGDAAVGHGRNGQRNEVLRGEGEHGDPFARVRARVFGPAPDHVVNVNVYFRHFVVVGHGQCQSERHEPHDAQHQREGERGGDALAERVDHGEVTVDADDAHGYGGHVSGDEQTKLLFMLH